jgi:hypothetical protein
VCGAELTGTWPCCMSGARRKASDGLCGWELVDLMAQPLNHSNSGVPLHTFERWMYRQTGRYFGYVSVTEGYRYVPGRNPGWPAVTVEWLPVHPMVLRSLSNRNPSGLGDVGFSVQVPRCTHTPRRLCSNKVRHWLPLWRVVVRSSRLWVVNGFALLRTSHYPCSFAATSSSTVISQ